ncbi:hypothetical protein [Acidicapsa ligni]|uniref:hypothetical protein n=1 Tax=Acidicapsa ligni TaxID=542300 RepID=UPI0021E095D1|nr:hypothetical protein [Acidicapsa ligni]
MPESRPDRSTFVSIAALSGLALCANVLLAQIATPSPSQLTATGQVEVDGRQVAYRVRHLPVSSFPDLPAPIAAELATRGCLIPQTYQARRPENVIHGSLEHSGSNDWAVLCSVNGQVSLLVFFSTATAAQPIVLATQPETDRLQQHDPSHELGFNWGIDAASPQHVHDALAGMDKRPAPLDHDALADSILDIKTVYHLYRNGAWERVVVDQSL